MKFINTKSFYKATLRRYGGMIIPVNTQTVWGSISYPMKFIGVNLRGYFLFEYYNGSNSAVGGTNVYIRNGEPKKDINGRNTNFLSLTAHQQGLDFLEKIYQSQKPVHHEEILSHSFHL